MYKHTQIGWIVIVCLLSAIALITFIYFLNTDVTANWVVLAVLLSVVIALILFSTLTVMVNDKEVLVKLGIGLFRKKIILKDIESVEVVKNKWWYGWGIRLSGKWWMFNVSGLDAVQVSIRNKKKFRIGTDEAKKLADFIKKKLTAKK